MALHDEAVSSISSPFNQLSFNMILLNYLHYTNTRCHLLFITHARLHSLVALYCCVWYDSRQVTRSIIMCMSIITFHGLECGRCHVDTSFTVRFPHAFCVCI